MSTLSTIITLSTMSSFIGSVQSGSLCITNGKQSSGESSNVLSGEYIESGSYNNQPYYKLDLGPNCGYNAAVMNYNSDGKWKISPNEVGTSSYFSKCSTTDLPQKCSLWDGFITSMSISSGECDRMCPNSNILEITKSGSNYNNCDGEFHRLTGQDADIFKNSNDYYWYFNYQLDSWICDKTQYNHGCSASSVNKIIKGYDGINSIASCGDSIVLDSSDTYTTTTTSTTSTTSSTDIPAGQSSSCSSIVISGRVNSNTFVNGEWIEVANQLINDKPYYTKGSWYLFFMSGCNAMNRWIITNSLYNSNDNNICVRCTEREYQCDTLRSYYVQCNVNTQNVIDCSGEWEFPSPPWTVDTNVMTSSSC